MTRKTDDSEWDVLLDGTRIGMVYRVNPGEYHGQYTYVESTIRLRGHSLLEWTRPTLREAAIEVEQHHSSEYITMQAIARARGKKSHGGR